MNSPFCKNKKYSTIYVRSSKRHVSSITMSMARDIANRILKKKFGATIECTVGKMKHLQQDAVSCEVLTYYYANQIARDDFIP